MVQKLACAQAFTYTCMHPSLYTCTHKHACTLAHTNKGVESDFNCSTERRVEFSVCV